MTPQAQRIPDPIEVSASVKTDVGLLRQRNEDSYLVDAQTHLYVVADGMGGHAGGERASKLAVDVLGAHVSHHAQGLLAIPGVLKTELDQESQTPPAASCLIEGIRAACSKIFQTAVDEPGLTGMGTTATALWLLPGVAYVAHVGDSRCYVRRQAQTIQITEDHSLVNEQIKAGLLTPEAAKNSRHKNIITRSVGFEKDVAVDTYLVATQPGDRFVLCSDGLSNLVERHELNQAMATFRGQELVDHLVALALERGGDDNITILSVDLDATSVTVEQTGSAPPKPTIIEGDTPPGGSVPEDLE